jgi:hypothetical protein
VSEGLLHSGLHCFKSFVDSGGKRVGLAHQQQLGFVQSRS